MKAYLTFGAVKREIKIRGLIQKGSLGAEFRCKGIWDLRRAFSFDAFRQDWGSSVSGLRSSDAILANRVSASKEAKREADAKMVEPESDL